MWTTGSIQKIFSVSHQTVRNWTKEFAEFLSDGATPQTVGGRRNFTVDDLRVFSLVVELTTAGSTYADAKVVLAKGKRGELPDTAEPEVHPAVLLSPKEIALTMSIMKERDEALGQLKQLLLDRTEDRQTIERLNREVGRLEAALEMERGKHKNQDRDDN